MKGVILGIAPAARVVDLTHDLPPQDIQAAAYHLSVAAPYLPVGTIHVVVVDPGVGTERRALAVETGRAMYIAPDNGVLTWILDAEPLERVVELTDSAYWLDDVSTTFHGRDIFGPAAAHLAAGVPLERLGEAVTDPMRLPVTLVTRDEDGSIDGQVQHIDHFGNAITNIPRATVAAEEEDPEDYHVRVAGRDIGTIGTTYGDVSEGEPLALFGSAGFLEIAVRNGDAAAQLGLHRGAHVKLTLHTT
jgi:S-adenosylmethionine hydrolase